MGRGPMSTYRQPPAHAGALGVAQPPTESVSEAYGRHACPPGGHFAAPPIADQAISLRNGQFRAQAGVPAAPGRSGGPNSLIHGNKLKKPSTGAAFQPFLYGSTVPVPSTSVLIEREAHARRRMGRNPPFVSRTTG